MLALPANVRPPHSPARGSVLITALIFSIIIAISLSSYIRLALNSLKLADRSFYQNAALNLAEYGLEQALYCYNRLDNAATPAAAWTEAGWPSPAANSSIRHTFSNFNLGPGVTGEVKVYCSSHNPGTGVNPVIVSRATVTFATGGAPFSKYMEVTLRKRSLFVNGLVAKDSISWVGHPTADSWNSDPDNNPTTVTAYSALVQAAGCTVGCVDGSITLGSGGNVYGYSKTGTSGTTSGGSVHGLGTTIHDTARVATDFSANFPPVTTPTPATVNFISSAVPADFPLATHNVNPSDGKYYFSFAIGKNISDTTTIGAAVPNRKVVFIMNNHQGVDAISFTGNKSLTVKTGSMLTIYTNGDIKATGNGMVNGTTAGANACSSLMIYGTSTAPSTPQEIKVGGNGQLYGAIYAPNANVELKGGGSSGMVLGSIVAKTINMNGGTDFHYDEALGNLGGGNPFGIAKWRELQSATERNVYVNELNF